MAACSWVTHACFQGRFEAALRGTMGSLQLARKPAPACRLLAAAQAKGLEVLAEGAADADRPISVLDANGMH